METNLKHYIEFIKNKHSIDDNLNKLINQVVEFWEKNPSLEYESFYSDHLGAYSTFKGSPISEGKFQFDLSGHTPSDRYDWEELRNLVKKHGIRNSLLVALMPTASTSQILGNNECFEPYTSNIYSRRTLAGDFVIVNKHLMKDLKEIGLWSSSLKDKIISNNGSVQNIDEIPEEIKQRYKIVWEIKQKDLIEMAIDRSHFVCQSQSMNLFFREPNMTNLSSALFYGWENGLKTGCYYVRSQPNVQAQQFTIKVDKKVDQVKSCPIDPIERANCEGCGG